MTRILLSIAALFIWLPTQCLWGQASFSYEQAFEYGMPYLLTSLPTFKGWANQETFVLAQPTAGGYELLSGEAGTEGFASIVKMGKLPTPFSTSTLPSSSAAISPDFQTYILVSKGDLYAYKNKIQEFRQLTDTPALMEKNPRFSPDGKHIAYTRAHNLFTMNLATGEERQLTKDGNDLIYNGWSSWVYMEEILRRSSHYAAFWWSPDSKKLAFLQFDDREVPTFTITGADGVHGEIETQRYPKAGDNNPGVKLGVVDIESGTLNWMDTNESLEYTAWPSWTPDGKELTFQQMNRGQNHLVIYAANPQTGKRRLLYEEKQKEWVQFFQHTHFQMLTEEKGFLIRSDKSGYAHIYHYSMEGALLKQLTEGEWQVKEILGTNSRQSTLYFTADKDNTLEQHLFSVGIQSRRINKITQQEGVHSLKASPDCTYFIDTYSDLIHPRKMVLIDRKGEVLKTLGEQATEEMEKYNWGNAETFTVPSGDGLKLPAYWILPPDFDINKKYPVIFDIYAGPDRKRVTNSFRNLQQHFYAQRGIIIFAVDHRGSGHFGKKGVANMHRNLGKWEMHDLIAGVKWLREQPFIDESKIGITGGSYGGYTTLMALTVGADYFTHGVSRAPVSDWRLYDAVYTERYMDTPEENPEGYLKGSTLTYLENLKGKLFLSHGTADDNVHMQNSLQVVDALTDLGKEFEFMAYPDQRHAYRGAKRTHFNKSAIRFWFKEFLSTSPDFQ
ncbi:MAG: S9 family peptidase [Bacteroidota bacterium]